MALPKKPESNDEIAQRIVAAAAKHFVEDGFAGASTASIATSARTSKREIYQRFGNKEALFEKVMAHLCASVEDPPPNVDDSLEESLKQIAMSVVRRFLQPQTRGVLISAIGASNSSPQIPRLFWQEGPGQAVTAIVDLLHSTNHADTTQALSSLETMSERYLFNCCGGFVLAYLFNEQARPSEQEVTQHIDIATAQFVNLLRQS